jgi:hypothetical protein
LTLAFFLPNCTDAPSHARPGADHQLFLISLVRISSSMQLAVDMPRKHPHFGHLSLPVPVSPWEGPRGRVRLGSCSAVSGVAHRQPLLYPPFPLPEVLGPVPSLQAHGSHVFSSLIAVLDSEYSDWRAGCSDCLTCYCVM